jgi:hypothetical protein
MEHPYNLHIWGSDHLSPMHACLFNVHVVEKSIIYHFMCNCHSGITAHIMGVVIDVGDTRGTPFIYISLFVIIKKSFMLVFHEGGCAGPLRIALIYSSNNLNWLLP